MAAGAPIKKLSKVIVVNPTISTGAYSSGQVIGGLQTLKDFFDSPSGVTEIIGAEIADGAKQNVALNLVIFGGKPAGSYSDGSTFNPSLADLKLIDSVIPIPTTAYTSFSANSWAQLNNIRNKVSASYNAQQLGPNSIAKNAYLVIVSAGAPTYGSTTAIAVQLDVEQDV